MISFSWYSILLLFNALASLLHERINDNLLFVLLYVTHQSVAVSILQAMNKEMSDRSVKPCF